MKKKFKVLTCSFLALLLFLSAVHTGNTIPAFARKYQISCQVCHSPAAPMLKPFGDDFAGAGFRMTEYESPRYYVPAGDENLSLIRDFPIAVRLDGHISYNNADKNSPDFGTPYGLKILSGGELSDKLSYYFYFYMNERGEVSGVEDAFLTYSDLFGTGINIAAGQFQVCDPLFKRELRLTLEDYKIYTTLPGNSRASLKYDRGLIVDYGLPTGTDLVVEIVNGSGIGEAGEGYLFDRDKYKNYMLRIKQSIGNAVSLGFFGYFGKEELADTPVPYINKNRMFGPDLSIDLGGILMLNMQYLRRSDSRVLMSTEPVVAVREDVFTQGGFAEVIYAPRGDRSKWYMAGLANWVESDVNTLDYQSLTLHVGYLLRRNVRLVSEYTRMLTGNAYGRGSLGFVAAF